MDEEIKPNINKSEAEEAPNILDVPKKFAENWNKVDELCPNCHQVTKRATGLTKQNLKRLLIGKPTFYDWAFFFIIVMTIFMAYRYNIETAQSAYMAEHFGETCIQMGYGVLPQVNKTNSILAGFDPSQLNITFTNHSDV